MTSKIFTTEDPVLRSQIPNGIPLIVTMRGLSDTGSVLGQLDSYFQKHSDPRPVIRFANDELMDYRSRRPTITFVEDHFENYEPEELLLFLAQDDMGAPFLLLSGFEPDLKWESFIDSLLLFVHEFSVSSVVWAHAIPMPVPHTRPIRMTVSGTRDDLIESYSVWKPTTKVPATATHIFEHRLHNLGEEVVGFALLVPHYLANTEYPDVLISALEGFMAATGLLFSTEIVREASEAFFKQVDLQIQENEESSEMVRGLEQRYDEYIDKLSEDVTLSDPGENDESVAQLVNDLERFLAQEVSDEPDTDAKPDEDASNDV